MPSGIRNTVERWPVVTFFVLAYAITWGLLPLLQFSPLFGLLGLFAPAVAGLVVARVTRGPGAGAALLRRATIWRVDPWCYLVAALLPPVIGYLVAALATARTGSGPVHLGPISPLTWVIFPLVVGEELGWRGYAQPTLAARHSPLVAALVVGILWGFWHLPTFYMTGLPQHAMPLPAFLLFTVAFSVVAGWILMRSGGSVLLTTLLHGSFNTFTFLTPVLDTSARLWWTALVWLIVAIVAATRIGPRRVGYTMGEAS